MLLAPPSVPIVPLGACGLVLDAEGDGARALQLRNALESRVIHAAVAGRRVDAAAFDRLLDDLDASRSDPLSFVRASWALHREIASLVSNAVLANLYMALLDIAGERLADVIPQPGYDRRAAASVGLHHELVGAILAGGGGLGDLVRRHDATCAG